MKSSPRALLVVLALLAFHAATAHARSPWSREAGHGYVQLAFYGILPYDQVILESGDEAFTSREISDATLELYAEHGLAPGWTVSLTTPLKMLSAGDVVEEEGAFPATIDEGSLNALGNLRLGLKRQLVMGPRVMAVAVEIEAPTSDFDAATGLRSGIDGWAVTPLVSYGQGGARSYWFGYAGVGIRTDDYSNEWRAGVEGGLHRGRWWWIASLEILQSFQDGAREADPANLQTALYLDQQEVVAPVLKAMFEMSDRWGLQTTLQGGFAGNFVARSPFVGVAAYRNY